MSNKISVITVVYNNIAHIRQTMESFFAQTWQEKEYIVIDGGSTDGTVDVIREYADRLAYWCSEKDDGIYHALNKGLQHCSGEWVNVLNSGDLFASNRSLELAITRVPDISQADVIYGDSIERSDECGDVYKRASDIRQMTFGPIYRHGSSLVRTSVQKAHPYDLSQAATYGYALDWLMIYRLYSEGARFQKTDTAIEIYLLEGASYGLEQNLKYNRMVITGRPLTLSDRLSIKRFMAKERFKKSNVYRWGIALLTEYGLNDVLPHIPSWTIRRFVMRLLKMKIGRGTFIAKRNYIMTPQQLAVGDHSHINRGCTIDARGGITIGNNVSISYNVSIMTGSHDYNSPCFRGRFLPIHIDDYVWIGNNAVIQQNITIGRGAVVCAGAVVTKDVPPFSVVAGVPARQIGQRQKNLNYQCKGFMPFV